MKYHVYILEAISYCDPISIRRKFRRHYRRDPAIKQSLLSVKLRHARSPSRFDNEMQAFSKWQGELTLQKDELILFWLSAHGMDRGGGPWLPSGIGIDNFDLFKGIDGGLQKHTVIFYSACWGGFPGISRIMHDRDGHGPCLLFGPTIAVDVSVLDHAEEASLRLLSSVNSLPVEHELIDHINQINTWGEHYSTDHRDFYRVWYWGSNPRQPRRHPEALSQYAGAT